MTACDNNHMKALLRLMKHYVDTKNRGWSLKPNMKWNGISKTFEVEVDGDADSNYATCVDTRKSVTGLIVRVCRAILVVKSGMQKIVALSTIEAEIIACHEIDQILNNES